MFYLAAAVRFLKMVCHNVAIILLIGLMTMLIFPLQPILAEEEVIDLEAVESVAPAVVEISEEEVIPEAEIESELVEEEEVIPEAELDSETIDQEEVIPEAEIESEPVEEEEVIIPEPPKVTLTPEQSFILALKEQITEIIQPYSNEQIEAIQINLYRHLLRVEMNEGWYELDELNQNEIIETLFEQAQQFQLTKLEVLNPEGNLIARSPLIGNRMIILERR